MTDFILDLHGTSETEQDARNKAKDLLHKPGFTVEISAVYLSPTSHSASVTYEYKAIPNYNPLNRDPR